MGMEYSTGPMALIMKGSGISTKPMDKVLSGMRKEMFIEVNSKMIWQTAMENTLI